MKPITHLLLALPLMLVVVPAQAELVSLGKRDALAGDRLAELRGSYQIGDGLQASFGITRTVAVNGEIVAVQGLVLRDLGRAFAGGTPTVERVGQALAVVGIGPNNDVARGASTPAGQGLAVVSLPLPIGQTAVAPGIVTGIQNTLNNTLVQTRTTIDATIESLGFLRHIHRAGAIRDGMVGR